MIIHHFNAVKTLDMLESGYSNRFMTEQSHQRAVKTEQLCKACSLAGQTLLPPHESLGRETTECGEDRK